MTELKKGRKDYVSHAIILLMVTVIYSACSVVYMQMLGFKTVGCSPACNEMLYDLASYALMATVIIGITLGAIGTFLLRKKSKFVLVAPVVAAAVIFIASIVLYYVGDAALTRT